MWIVRDFGGALKFVNWLISSTRRTGFFPMLGELISRVAYLRKGDYSLYQNWIEKVEDIPADQNLPIETYDLIVMLDSVEGDAFQLFLKGVQRLSWVNSLTVVLQDSVTTTPPFKTVNFIDYETFKSNQLECNEEKQHHIVLIHTLVLFESAWIPEIDSVLTEGADLVVTDQDSLGNLQRINPYFKPGFSQELIFDPAYAPCLFLTKALFCDVLAKMPSVEKVVYKLFSSLMSAATSPKHVSRVVIHLLEKPLPWKALSHPYRAESRILDLSTSRSHFPEVYKPIEGLSISIIIPIKDNIDLLISCIETISKHDYQSKYEILVLDNQSKEQDTLTWLMNAEASGLIRCIRCDFDFNWSKLSNIGIEKSDSDVIVLLNNDTLVISNDWLDRLAALAMEDDIGVVGPLLKYPDEAIQHAGVILGFGGFADHIYLNEPVENRGREIYVSPLLRRDVSACTGACQVFSRQTYLEIGSFNEKLHITGDIEFCLRSLKKGKRNIYEPCVSLYHLESKTRRKGLSEEEKIALKESIGELTVLDDRYYNKNLSRSSRSPMFNLLAQ